MQTDRLSTISALALIAMLAACANEERPLPLAPPNFDLTSGAFITGQVLGPAGNVCNSLPDGTLLTVRPIDLATQAFAGLQFLNCPDNAYSFFEGPGTYMLRVTLPADSFVLGVLPWRTVAAPATVFDGDVARDVFVPVGTPLGGGASFDGQPIAGVDLSLVYGDAPIFGVTTAASGPDGGWSEFFSRTPVRLQAGVNMLVTAACAQLLGGRVDQGPPAGPFLFPDEVSSVTCALSTASAVRFSHQRTRVVVTALPGDIGGLSPELDDQYGTGWGVQFPIDPAVGPEHASITRSQLFRGGLIVGIRPNRVLSGIGIDGYFLCAPACRDFGFDGTVKVKTSDKQGTTVTWRYSDARSVEGVGLKVKQKSYDGSAGDYVLFRFTFTNTRSAAVTFYAGMFADWDIDDDAFDDVGATDLGGRLMYMTNAGGGTAAGALVVSSAPVSGNTFFTSFNQTMETLVSALAGDFSVPSVDQPNDHRFVNSVGPITLRRDASADVWIAIVAGEDVSQLMSNAAAASAEIARRRGEKDDSNEGVPGDSVRAGTHAVRPGIAPTCKRGCSQ